MVTPLSIYIDDPDVTIEGNEAVFDAVGYVCLVIDFLAVFGHASCATSRYRMRMTPVPMADMAEPQSSTPKLLSLRTAPSAIIL
jgi:hypothetical protein